MNPKFRRRVTYVHGLSEEMQVTSNGPNLGLTGCEGIHGRLLYYAL